MENTQYFAAGYLIFIIVLFAYIFNLHSRLKKLQSEVNLLKK